MRQYLHHNDFGCVARCVNGCCLHLCFGNVALCLQLDQLAEWRNQVAQLYEHHAATLPDPAARCLTLPGPVPQQAFVFTLEELFALLDLLTCAALLLEVEALLAPTT
jgi:hypothetical protein